MNEVWLSTVLKKLVINGNCGAQQKFFASIKVLQEIVLFQKAEIRILNFGVQCEKWLDFQSQIKKSDSDYSYESTSTQKHLAPVAEFCHYATSASS